jgi:methionine-rich copper-binding protein CopC
MMTRTLVALARRLSLSFLLCCAVAEQAIAHAQLVSSSPAANEMAMPPPSELRLKFSEGLELKFTTVKVKGLNGAPVKTGPLKIDASDGSLLIVPLPSPLPAGQCTVDWQVVGKDGHKTKGHYSFISMQ